MNKRRRYKVKLRRRIAKLRQRWFPPAVTTQAKRDIANFRQHFFES